MVNQSELLHFFIKRIFLNSTNRLYFVPNERIIGHNPSDRTTNHGIKANENKC